MPHIVTPRFGARLIQDHHRLHFLSNRASLTGEWEEVAIDQLEAAFPAIIKELETKLLTGELDAQRQQRISIQHCGFTCDADTLGSHGYVYIAVYAASVIEVIRTAKPCPPPNK
ncbi:type IV toxin-antitoxin system YeeU family antitoxin [Aeromonas allosaccharophila]|uniref:type IV toxin-antitoxin system YeeU family antitoxin n=1 Tax=Aeromonas allosaccharophila TaxID=656 RepID=UPI002AE05E69|nr:type IV toxin-antitoxin system YeeU family antitoxin [Aeromonas allosaccharophila]